MAHSPPTSEWRLKELGRMTKEEVTYLQSEFNITELQKRLDTFIETASTFKKHHSTQTEFNKDGILWCGTNITNDCCFTINSMDEKVFGVWKLH
jgi:hypothetical protein